ncbi:D-glycero-beta-D-manno-heptose-7-phosphate kinase [Candidatus Saganbacteria bacterium]|nr:D-glycero-beta-D-manno-heptose-7-phosphate kinase [Candidatus Saganbacteria bacterium]
MNSEIIKKFKGRKILVFGDVMLDEHIWSRVERISPEAPVPIADVYRITHVPGGCGNVAVNVAALGGLPYLVGLIGHDGSGEKLRKALKQAQVSPQYLIVDRQRPTILKSRIIAAAQHVVRVDREDRTDILPNLRQEILKSLKRLIPQMDGVIISDYAKGMIDEETAQAVIQLARQYKKFVAVDPKGHNYAKYRGASVITPNLNEAAIAAAQKINNEKSLAAAGRKIIKEISSQYLLITRGRDGMSLFSQSGIIHIPAIPREVFDITGAGDTVIAVLSLAVAARASVQEACLLANTAASIVVGKIGTAPCSREELVDAVIGHEPIIRKIKLRQELKIIAQQLQAEGKKIIFTNGCFDLLHLGHVRYLREAKKLGDVLIIGVNTDRSVRRLKGPERPYVSELERAEILASLECVDYVTLFSELRPDNLIKIVRPDVHVKGGDYSVDQLPEKALVETLGGRIVVIPPIKGRSTTNIVDKILGRKI